jgi:DNA repair exonuclease SbcCD ATPase subunit
VCCWRNEKIHKHVEFKETKIPEIQKQIKDQDKNIASIQNEIEKALKSKQDKNKQINDINNNYKQAAIAKKEVANTLKMQIESQIASVKGYIDHHNNMTDGSGCFARNPILVKQVACGQIEEYCGVNLNVADID